MHFCVSYVAFPSPPFNNNVHWVVGSVIVLSTTYTVGLKPFFHRTKIKITFSVKSGHPRPLVLWLIPIKFHTNAFQEIVLFSECSLPGIDNNKKIPKDWRLKKLTKVYSRFLIEKKSEFFLSFYLHFHWSYGLWNHHIILIR